MRRNARCPRPEVLAPRRGNSIVLVMGILVLLVIIATAFITRTHAGRVTANVTVRTTLRDDNARVIAEMIAQEIGLALFPHPVDQTITPPGDLADSNTPRLSPLRHPIRYGVDQDVVDNSTGLPPFDGFPDHPYNFPPYHVVPSTNWPDVAVLNPNAQFWPAGPGNTGPGAGLASPFLAFEGNGVGNPGFSDARWLADVEPLRKDTNGDGVLDAYSQWRHMTNIARPNNGWRIVGDISNVENSLVTDLNIPVEQWLASILPANAEVGNPDAVLPAVNVFESQWVTWFDFDSHRQFHFNSLSIPANFYRLNDLNANGFFLESGERPEDEFIAGTARHAVSSVLADTDGDGYTDSFWNLAPTMTERGIRQVVAMRIIDNSAMLNANVATRFDRENSTGATPSDLALVGDVDVVDVNVGLFDNPAHHEADSFLYGDTNIGYNPDIWDDTENVSYLGEIGVLGNPFFPLNLGTVAERLQYWVAAGRDPLSPALALTPFTFTEELELRMFNGQNYPWIASRFERAVQANVSGSLGEQFLHANLGREESSEYLDQLSNRELVFDHRKQLTMYSGARNDEMPPWLWWRWDIPQDIQQDADNNPGDNDGNGVPDVIDRFLAQARTKVDLRQPELGFGPVLPPGVRNFRQRLAPTLLLALIDGDGNSGTSYFGEYSIADQTNLDRARLAAAGLAANIREWRDDDSELDLDDAEPRPKLTAFDPDSDDVRMLGMERQPFLVEALIAHVYELVEAQFNHLDQDPPILQGEHVLCNDPPTAGAVVVVQIANPFGTVLDLSKFQLSVFGMPAPLSGTLNPFASRTFYAIEDDLGGEDLDGEWRLLLALPFPPDSVDVSGTWSTTPGDYATIDEERAVEIVRMIPPVGVGPDVPVVVDRIDIKAPQLQENYAFGEAVEGMRASLPSGSCNEQDPWLNVVSYGSDTHWIQWIQVTRAWDVDFNRLVGFQADEVNPRYVFSIRDVDRTDAEGSAGTEVVPGSNPATFDTTDKNFELNGKLEFSMQMLQKDGDFEQVGEPLNVWMFGHELEFDLGAVYVQTTQTFSEFMIDDDLTTTTNDDPLVNRLRMEPTSAGATLGQVVGIPLTPDTDPNYLLDPQHAVPALPAGARVLDAFVCDDRGVNGTVGVDEFLNANGYSGKITPGLINVNTAPIEVMRALPHMTRMVHELASPATNFYVRLPEAIIRYRERFGDPASTNAPPAYGDRGATGGFVEGMRSERGLASISEVLLLTKGATFSPRLGPLEPNENWQVDFAGLRPPAFGSPGSVESTRISTDVNDVFDPNLPGDVPDEVAQDAEELNLLFAGMSNMLTTRSDVFTVYFRVRSFIQNPTTRVWDATNPEFIVDDSRYVMLVDRSEVNRPNDKPKILYLEKLPK